MIELSRHIENLLLSHDCVIVPNLGGFVAQYVAARYVPEEEIYLPPMRTVGFNPQLTLNDGLLVQSYMTAYDTSFPEAVRMIESVVEKLKAELQNAGNYELSGIGTLIGVGDSHYDFRPTEAGLLSPALYALDAFCPPRIAATAADSADGKTPAAAAPQRKAAPSKRLRQKVRRNYTLRINRELVNYAAAAVAAIIFYFVWAAPVAVENSCGQSQASFFAPAPPASLGRPAAAEGDTLSLPVATQAATALPAAEEARPAAAEHTAPEAEEGAYTVVLASRVSKRNAEAYVAQLQSQGLAEAAVSRRGTVTRVIFGSYPDESAAQRKAEQLRRENGLQDAWVMPLR